MSPNSDDSSGYGTAFDRRTVLGLLGAGGVGAAMTGTATGDHDGGDGPTRHWDLTGSNNQLWAFQDPDA